MRVKNDSDAVLNKVPYSIWLTSQAHECRTPFGCIYRAPSTPSPIVTTVSSLLRLFPLITPSKSVLAIMAFQVSTGRRTALECFESKLGLLDIHGWQQHVHLPTRNHNTLDFISCHNVTPTSVVIGRKFHIREHKTCKTCTN